MRAFPSVLLGLSLALPITASATTFYLHHGGSPVPVPGGTTSFFLDEIAPTAGTVTVEAISVPKKTTVAFPTFTAPAFGVPATVGLAALGTVHLSANLAMNGCAALTISVEHVSVTGDRTTVAQGSTSGLSIPQGGLGGTSGFLPLSVASVVGCFGPFADLDVTAGESIAVTVAAFNACKANRTISLAYDATVAPGMAVFSPVPAIDPAVVAACQAKCKVAKSKCVRTYTTAILKCHVTAEAKGLAADPLCFQKAMDKFTLPDRGCIEKAEGHAPCATFGDAAVLKAKQDAFVLDAVQELDAGYPAPVLSKCSSQKKKCVATLAKILIQCDEKGLARGIPTDPLCVQKASDKFTLPSGGCMEKADLKPPCLTGGDGATLRAKVLAFVADVAGELSPP